MALRPLTPDPEVYGLDPAHVTDAQWGLFGTAVFTVWSCTLEGLPRFDGNREQHEVRHRAFEGRVR